MTANRSKIFQIGFNKCGTRTIHHFFARNGLKSLHWEGGKIAKAMLHNRAASRSLIEGYEDFDVFTDMEWLTATTHIEAFKFFPEIADAFPDARFILNTRDRENWIQSRLAHDHRDFVGRWMALTGLTDPDALAAHWREEWDRHHRNVRDFFADAPERLVVFDIEQDSPETLAKGFPELDLNTRFYKHRGKTRNEPA